MKWDAKWSATSTSCRNFITRMELRLELRSSSGAVTEKGAMSYDENYL